LSWEAGLSVLVMVFCMVELLILNKGRQECLSR